MPSSPPGPPSAGANTGPANKPDPASKAVASTVGIVFAVLGAIVAFLWHFGAASLSYAKYGSIGWAIVDFFFATLYYPYYALVLNTPTPTMGMMTGGIRRLRKLMG